MHNPAIAAAERLGTPTPAVDGAAEGASGSAEADAEADGA